MQRLWRSKPDDLIARRYKFDFVDGPFRDLRGQFSSDGTSTATEAFMKRTLVLLAAVGLLGAAAGCNRSSSTNENPAVNTNGTSQNAGESASHAWEDTKGAATNAWNATKVEATNAWNKTTNAIH